MLLEVNNLTKIYDNNTATEKTVIKEMNLAVRKNEFLCILGPSGCGKTTLLRCIAGFEDYDGIIRVDGETVTKPGIDRIVVFQDYNQLFPWLTVEKNIQFSLKEQGIKDKAELKKKSDEALKKVRLENVNMLYPHQLSGGMKQRVAIAKALALKPKILLMDEPFAALDAMTRNKLQQELVNLSKQEDCTFIFITHNIQEAIVLGTRIMVLASEGEVLVNEENTIEKPVLPSSPGYGELWDRLREALY